MKPNYQTVTSTPVYSEKRKAIIEMNGFLPAKQIYLSDIYRQIISENC